jgi:hypothetical protein
MMLMHVPGNAVSPEHRKHTGQQDDKSRIIWQRKHTSLWNVTSLGLTIFLFPNSN